jgi:hypothetical protein
MLPSIRLWFKDGLFIPLDPVDGLQDGEILEFRIPDPDIVYLCETDRLAALDNGKVIRVDTNESMQRDGTSSTDA